MEDRTDDQIQELGRRWAEAELGGDTVALDSLLDGAFEAVGPLGFVLTKEEWLDRHRTGDLQYQELSWAEPETRRYGDAAIVIGTQVQRATYKGNDVPGSRFRMTQVAIRKGDGWVLAGVHLSPIVERP